MRKTACPVCGHFFWNDGKVGDLCERCRAKVARNRDEHGDDCDCERCDERNGVEQCGGSA
jgi:hypothetical protein